jgi:hypothetical protein
MGTRPSYSRNHYVPIWYQKRFLQGETTFFLLDKSPEIKSQNGHSFTRRNILPWGPKRCFVIDDLYTTRWGEFENRDIEKHFFGRMEAIGENSCDFFENFDIRAGTNNAIEGMLEYLSLQKMRTPNGLNAFAELTGIRDNNKLLIELQHFRRLHSAIFCDSVWQIASAERSKTKFIVSDSPVTIYNQRVFSNNPRYSKILEPDIRRVGSQTIFPLSSSKILILTNLSWARNPYQNPLKFQPNPKFLRNTIIKSTDIQIGRLLSENEVIQINYILKTMAQRYVASPEKQWLFPEEKLPKVHWSKFGNDLLLHPDPRCIHMGGKVYVGYKDGSSEAWNEFGHRPWEQDFENERRDTRDGSGLQRVQAEFDKRYGDKYRGVAIDYVKIRNREFFEPS